MRYWDNQGNQISFKEALKFQARSPGEYAAAQARHRKMSMLPPDVIAAFRDVRLHDDGTVTSSQGGGSIAGANARVDTSGSKDIASRRTMMRTVTPLAILGQKKMKSDTRQCFLVVEGRGWAITQSVPLDKEGEARAFAARLNSASAAASPTPSLQDGAERRPRPTPADDGLTTQLAKLGDMKQAGLLSDEEFAAAKARLLGAT